MTADDRKAQRRRVIAVLQILSTPGARVAALDGRAVLMRGGAAVMTLGPGLLAGLRRRGFLARRAGAETLSDLGRAHLESLGVEDIGDRARHGAVTPLSAEASEAIGGAGWFDAAESPLAWLRARKGRDGAPLIEDAQYLAGEKLRADATRASLSPRLGVDLTRVAVDGSTPETFSDGTLAARRRVERALTAVGPGLSGVALDVCVFLKGVEQVEQERGWPRRTGRVVLGLALDRLAAHYGIDAVARGRETGRTGAWRAPAEVA
jgi:hypothetical protein